MSMCWLHSVEPDALYGGCMCTHGGVIQQVQTYPELPESMLGVVDFYEDDEPLADLLEAFEAGEKGVTAPPPSPVNHGLHWTVDEINLLRQYMYVKPTREIAQMLGRSENACREMYLYGTVGGKDNRELARLETAKISDSFRGRWSGTTLEEMGY